MSLLLRPLPACPVCGSDDVAHSQYLGWNEGRCKSCGFTVRLEWWHRLADRQRAIEKKREDLCRELENVRARFTSKICEDDCNCIACNMVRHLDLLLKGNP